jgi:hypothetical protein
MDSNSGNKEEQALNQSLPEGSKLDRDDVDDMMEA